ISSARNRCSYEGHRAGEAETRDPRSAGRGGRELPTSPRVRGRGSPGRAGRRPRAGRRRSRARARRARADVRAAAREPADRVVRDIRDGAVNELRPKIAVVVFPGSNDDGDAVLALDGLGAESVFVWHGDPELPDVSAVVLPGGFSYGDYLRCGAIARFAPVMAAVTRFAAEGGLVLGICNGFQVLCEARLLPGTLRPNTSLSFVCRDVPLVVERTDTPFTSLCDEGQVLAMPVKHGEGCYFADDDLLAEL